MDLSWLVSIVVLVAFTRGLISFCDRLRRPS